MWNMGLLFLIYYCVSIYSAKGDTKDGQVLPLDVGALAEDAGDAEANGEDTPERNSESSVLDTTLAFEVPCHKDPRPLRTKTFSDSLRRVHNRLPFMARFPPGAQSGTTARPRLSSSFHSR